MNRNTIPHFLFLSLLILTISSCSHSTQKQEETATSGKFTIYTDEAFKPIVDAEKATFEALYFDVSINIQYVPELKAIDALLKDSTDIVICGRQLSSSEKEYFSKSHATVAEYHLATDALAFILNKKLNDSLTSEIALKSVLSGKFTTWKQLLSSGKDLEIILVFDQSNSANLKTAIDKFGLDPKKVRIFAAGSAQEVCTYVNNNPLALGVLGASWLSDEDASQSKKIRKDVQVLYLKNEEGKTYSPFQSSVYESSNPFSRKIYAIYRNKNSGPASGFISFLMSDRGQRILLKSGIMPAIQPGRELLINSKKE